MDGNREIYLTIVCSNIYPLFQNFYMNSFPSFFLWCLSSLVDKINVFYLGSEKYKDVRSNINTSNLMNGSLTGRDL